MRNYHWMAKMGGMVAIASILFLPMAGCDLQSITGIDMFKANEISVIVKMLLAISLICAVSVIFLKSAIPILAGGVVGLAALIIAYLSAKSATSISIELRAGAYFTIVSFIIILMSGFFLLGTKIFKNIFGKRASREY